MEVEGGTPDQGRGKGEGCGRIDTIPVYGSLLAAISGYALAPIQRPSSSTTPFDPSDQPRRLPPAFIPLTLSPPPSFLFLSLFLSLSLSLFLSLSPSVPFHGFISPSSFHLLVFYLCHFFSLSSHSLLPLCHPDLDIIAAHCILLTPTTIGLVVLWPIRRGMPAWILIPARCAMDGRQYW